jgi:hypothetical protein
MKRTTSALALISALLLSILLVVSVPSLQATSEAPHSQWSKTYGAYRANSVVETTDGGYAIAGENATQDFRGYSGYLPLLIKMSYAAQDGF